MNTTGRVIVGSAAAVAVGLIGGLIMGEYQLLGVVAILAGALFGLAVAEAAITVAKSSDWTLVAIAGVAAFLGFAWGSYIEAYQEVGSIDAVRWVGSAVALASAGWWVRTFGSRALRKLFDEEPQDAPPVH